MQVYMAVKPGASTLGLYTRVMDPITGASLGILMRWIHITSVITAIGGLLYAGLVIAPALSSLPAETRLEFAAAVNSPTPDSVPAPAGAVDGTRR